MFSNTFLFLPCFWAGHKNAKLDLLTLKNYANNAFFKSKHSPEHWFHEKFFPSKFHVFEHFNFKTWHVLKFLIRILKRYGKLFQTLILYRKFWLKICSFSNKSSWWKLFCFKVCIVKFSIRKLTGDKMVGAKSDTLQKCRFKFWRASKNWPEVRLVSNCFWFLDLRQDALSRNWNKMSLALEVLIRELFFPSPKKAFLWIMIFGKSRKCQKSRFYSVTWHQKMTSWNQIPKEIYSLRINVFSKIWCFVVFSIRKLRGWWKGYFKIWYAVKISNQNLTSFKNLAWSRTQFYIIDSKLDAL